MESYHKRKKLLEEKYGKLINLRAPATRRPFNDDVGIADKGLGPLPQQQDIADTKQQNYVRAPATRRQLQDITDEEGLNRAYATKDGLDQHYNKLFIAGTKDPIDFVDDLKLHLMIH